MSAVSSVTCPKCGFVSWKTTTCRRCAGSLADAPTFTFQPPALAEGEGVPLYFAVSPTKLIVLSICTFGLYETYWFYKQWQVIKQNERSDIRPFWRAVFCIFYMRALFRSIKDTAALYDVAADFNPLTMSLTFLGLNLCARFGNVGWLLAIFSFYPLTVVQGVANQINARVAPDHDRNAQFTAGNIVTILIGGLLLALALFGTLMTLLGLAPK
jgi:hypothetical protein